MLKGRTKTRMTLLKILFKRFFTEVRQTRTRPTAPTRILILHYLLLGDTLMLTALCARLREVYPEAEIILTVPPVISKLYSHCPYGIKTEVFNPHDVNTFLTLQKKYPSFDLAFIPGDNRYSIAARALGAKWIIGLDGEHSFYKNYFIDEFVPLPTMPITLTDLFSNMVDGQLPTPFLSTQWEDPICRPFACPNTKYCILHVGASNTLRYWNNTSWQNLAATLSTRGYQVVFTAGNVKEALLVKEIDPDEKYLHHTELDLAQLWHLLKHAALVICPDTGVAHLAKLVQTPTLVLFGQGNPELFGKGHFWRHSPFESVFIKDISCRDQHELFGRMIPWVHRCKRTAKQCQSATCMQRIDVPMVLQKMQSIHLS